MRLAFPFKLIAAMALAAPLLASGPGTDPVIESGASSAAGLARMQQLAQQGNAEAQNLLGFMYHKGQGVPQNDAEAVRWFRKAAEQGEAGAQNLLGIMYALGQGVPQDQVAAYALLNVASSKGTSTVARDLVAKELSPGQLRQAQSISQQIYDSGNLDALYAWLTRK